MTLRPALVLLLACLLAFDAATPLLPGAFRFDADESVDVVRPVPVRAGIVGTSLSPAPVPVATLAVAAPALRPSPGPRIGAGPRHRPPRAAVSPERGRSPSLSDDH